MKSNVVLVLFLTFCTPCLAQEPCAELMKFGIYDKYQTLTTEFQYTQVQKFFKSNEFKTRQQAEKKSLDIGINIVEILGIDFGGKSSTKEFELWQQEFLATSYQQAISAGLKIQTVETISTAITELVAKCLTKKGVHAYVIPSADKQHFTFTIDYVPLSDERPKIKGRFTVTPSSVAASASPRDLLDKEIEIGPQGVSVSFKRLPTETVTITYNTKDQSGVVRYDAFVVPKPIVSFRAASDKIQAGETTKLVWDVQNAESVEIVGKARVQEAGSIDIAPDRDTEYQLKVVSLDGKTVSSFVKVTVLPPPPVLTAVKVHFHTTNDNKDHDTRVTTNVVVGTSVIATASETYGEFKDNTDSGWKELRVIEKLRKETVLSAGRFQLIEGPRGHDEWHFRWALELTFSDGSSKRFEGNGDVDHDRTTITSPF